MAWEVQRVMQEKLKLKLFFAVKKKKRNPDNASNLEGNVVDIEADIQTYTYLKKALSSDILVTKNRKKENEGRTEVFPVLYWPRSSTCGFA